MPYLKFISFILLVKICESAMPPTLPGPAPYLYPEVPVSPSYGPGPIHYSPVTPTPSYPSSPSSNSYSTVPSSPTIPDPYLSTPDSYPPVVVPAPTSNPPEPASPSPSPSSYPPEPEPEPSSPSPSPSSYPPESASPSPSPSPSPSSYPPEPASPSPSPSSYPPEPTSPSPSPSPSSSSSSYPPEPASPSPSPSSHPPESASPSPSPSSYPPVPKHRPRGIRAAYWPSFEEFPASSIETSYFTHICYAFLLPEPNTYKLNVTSSDLTKIPEFMDALQTRNPPVKKLLSIGGAGNNRTVFSQMVSFEETRAIFIESTIEVARRYGFDGVDLDWEFPENEKDMLNLALLYKQWRTALNYEAKISGKSRLFLTSAVYFASNHNLYGETATYPAEAICKYLDWISPMCFDYHGSWDYFTGVHSALYDPNGDLTTSYGIGSWLQAGLPPKKLVMGLPLYGRTWKLQDPILNGIGAPAIGVGPGDGILDYNQIVDFNSDNNATVKLDWKTVSYYSYAGDSWIGYDDVWSIKIKVQFARLRGLRGYFFWALGSDKDWTISRQASNAWGH